MTKKRPAPSKIILNVLCFILAAVWWLPIVWTLIVSIKPLGAMAYKVETWFQPPFTLSNFDYVFNNGQSDVLLWLFNSTLVSGASTLGVAILSLMAAYSFSKFDYKGKQVWFWVVMAGMMVPFQTLVIPIYLMFKQMHLLNTYWCLILPGLGSSFGVILLKQFMDGLPESLFDAAKIDGANSATVLFRIVAPLTKPALASLMIFMFLQRWNEFLWPFVSITKQHLMTIPVGIVFFRGQYSNDIAYSMAANVVASVPVLIVFFLFQKQIVKGIAFSGIKD